MARHGKPCVRGLRSTQCPYQQVQLQWQANLAFSLSRQPITKMLISLCGCTGLLVLLLVACKTIKFLDRNGANIRSSFLFTDLYVYLYMIQHKQLCLSRLQNWPLHRLSASDYYVNILSRDMRIPTMWYVRPAKAQTSLRIRTCWPKPLLVAWIFNDC